MSAGVIAMLMVGCPSIHQLSVAVWTADCQSVRRLPVCLSVRLHTHSCFLNVRRLPTVRHSVRRRFDRRLPVYVSVRLPVLY